MQFTTAIVTNGIGAVCAAAVLWFAYYRETRTIPQMMAAFTTSLTAAQAAFEARNNRVIDTFADQMSQERAVCQKWHEENRQKSEQILLETKENRHLIRDLAHVAGLRKAIEDRDKELEDGPAKR